MRVHKKIFMSLKKRFYLSIGKRFHIKKIRGLIYMLDMKNRVDRQVDAFSIYEKPQVDFLFAQLKDNSCGCFLDIGSHWGYYSLLFAKESCFEHAKIYAFEPDMVNRYQLYGNLFLNKLQDRVRVFEYAISKEEGEVKFHRFDDNNRGRSRVADDGELVVRTARLDTHVKEKGQTIGVKIDVEGHELDVIAGMTELLANNNCILQIESFVEVLPALKEVMDDLGYSMINTIMEDHYFVKKS
jgi:FkbM family methyltransferase